MKPTGVQDYAKALLEKVYFVIAQLHLNLKPNAMEELSKNLLLKRQLDLGESTPIKINDDCLSGLIYAKFYYKYLNSLTKLMFELKKKHKL